LSLEDFDRFEVWEFALDEETEEGQDETTVRPFEFEGALDPSEGMFVIRASFTLADGTTMKGYLSPPFQGDDSLGTLQPIIVAPGGHVLFWCGRVSITAEDIAANYRRLGKVSPEQVFPVRFKSEVSLVDGPVTGELPGFIVVEDPKSMRTRILT
jgi:hypothetical protein